MVEKCINLPAGHNPRTFPTSGRGCFFVRLTGNISIRKLSVWRFVVSPKFAAVVFIKVLLIESSDTHSKPAVQTQKRRENAWTLRVESKVGLGSWNVDAFLLENKTRRLVPAHFIWTEKYKRKVNFCVSVNNILIMSKRSAVYLL